MSSEARVEVANDTPEGGSVIAEKWFGGGATYSNGHWSPQLMGGTPGITVSGTYGYKVGKTPISWW
jgi:hypothetical protein